MIAFYILATLALIQGLISLMEGVRYLRFVRESFHEAPSEYLPKAAIIAPCKGLEPDLRENVLALLGQNYPEFDVLFVTESDSDPAHHQIQGLLREQCHPHADLMNAGPARDRGQKVHNLLQALDEIADDVEVLVFVDTDGTVPSEWLKSLVAPLADSQVGAATGYRWYVPQRGNGCSVIRSLWNASIATALGRHRRNFAWGGSTAIRRENFEKAGVRQDWAGACSDDFPLTRALKKQGMPIIFVPLCLVPTRSGCTGRQLLQFTTRQMVITRVYSPSLWWLTLVTNAVFCVAFWGGLGILAWRWWNGLDQGLIPFAVGGIYGLGVAKSFLRQVSVEMILSEDHQELKRYRLAYWTLFPLANLLFLYNMTRSAVSRRIEWRGVRYELISPTKTTVVGKES